jgi:NAD(P)-dependent dehydrogenase (short-subunit alcohol dehydrogenase family)
MSDTDADPSRTRLLRIAPLIRGLLATPTGDQDHPFARVIVRPFCMSEPAELEADVPALEVPELAGDRLAERLKAACAAYADQHGGARPRALVLPGLGSVRATTAPTAPSPTCALPNHVSLVTGAAGAIGAGICRGLLEAGSHVAATDLPGERLESLVEELREIDADRVLGVPLDVTDPASVAAGLDQIIATWGGVDLAVINAGVAHVSKLEEMDLEAFRRLERINVEGALLLLQAMARHFRLQGTGGDVVLISTKNVLAPGASFGAYSATKAAAHQLARIASLELAELGVRVNLVAPDAVFGEGARKSGLWQEIGPERMRARGLDEQGLEDYYRSRNLLKARVTPEHVARAVLFFATRQTPTTGATLPVDGGLPDAVPR